MKKVLIIEDNPDNLALIEFVLQAAGYETHHAETGYKGVELALQGGYEFIILDIQLPDIDGTEVLKIIRREEQGNIVPVIAMTSYAMSGDRERLLADGCTGYIEKPIEPMQVMAQIGEILRGAR